MAKILHVEDDEGLGAAVRDWLQAQRLIVETASSGNQAKQLLRNHVFDLIILDWELPEIAGVELCRAFRAEGGRTPVIMVTGRDHVHDKVFGLDSGADDYITKPFSMEELYAKIRAILRRVDIEPPKLIQYGDLQLDMSAHAVKMNGKDIALSPSEFQVLSFMICHAREIHAPNALVHRIWNGGSTIEAVRTYISQVRKRLASVGSKVRISSVPSVGYKITGETLDA